MTWPRSSIAALPTRIWVSVPMTTSIPSRTRAKAMNRPSNRVTWPIRARPTMLEETSIRNVVIRLSTSFWVVVLVARRLQCSVASSCALTDGGVSATEGKGLANESLDGRPLNIGRRAQRDEPELLAPALQELARVVELAPAVEIDRRVIGIGADPHDVRTADGIARDLPHRSVRAWWLAAIGDLVGPGSDLHDRSARSYDGWADLRRQLSKLF